VRDVLVRSHLHLVQYHTARHQQAQGKVNYSLTFIRKITQICLSVCYQYSIIHCAEATTVRVHPGPCAECRLSAVRLPVLMQTKSNDLACQSACRLLYHPQLPSPFIIITQPEFILSSHSHTDAYVPTLSSRRFLKVTYTYSVR